MVQDGVFEVGIRGRQVRSSHDEVAELVSTPSTEKVYDRPVLVVPPIGRYYHLAPVVASSEHAVGCGLQTC